MTSGRRLLKWMGGLMVIFLVFVSARSMLRGGGGGEGPGKIGLVQMVGPMIDSKKVASQLLRFGEDPSIKAILFRVDSPGGGVGVAQEITREVERVRQRGKKVVVSMGSVAASGGYYVSAGADLIMANPGTITGSIGVIISFTNAEELMKKIGVNFDVVKSGEFKDVGSPSRKMTLGERRVLQDMIDDAYRQFVEVIAAGRAGPLRKVCAAQLKIAEKDVTKDHIREAVLEAAKGQIYSGSRAKDMGLVDELGNFNDAMAKTKQLVGLPDSTEVVEERKRFSIRDYLLGDAADSVSRILGVDASPVRYQLQF